MKTALELPSDLNDQLVATLRHSVDLETPSLFVEIASWTQTTLLFRNYAPSTLTHALDALALEPNSYVTDDDEAAARATIRLAREELNVVRLCEMPLIDESTENGRAAKRYVEALLEGDEQLAAREVLLAIAHGQKTLEVYQEIITPALHEVGRLWQRDEITVAHEHVISNASERIIAQLIDLAPPRPHRDLNAVTAAIGYAQHQIGARMVADAFSMCGWHARFLGSELPIVDLLRYVDDVSIDVICLSGTIARDVIAIRNFVEELETRPLAPLVIVGGRIFDRHPDLWRKTGADAHAASPLMAVALAKELISHDCDSAG
jgi:methanogenic corrinoid protein MtbC1